MKHSNRALLVIDVQESFRHRPYFTSDALPQFFERLQKLCDGATALGIPIVQVLHVEDEGAFSEDSGYVVPMAEIKYQPALRIKKRNHSALAGTELCAWLVAHGIDQLIVSGIRTEQCCETTTRQASDSGYKVDFVTEATLTFPMKHKNGRVYTAADIKERTELVLADRFACICSVEESLC